MEIIKKYFDKLSSDQLQKFEAMGPLYTEWNSKINVVSRKDIDEIYTRHILHSLAITKIITFKHGTQILDVGCGGGFPGIPLAVMFPEVKFTLVDSIGKKIKVVNEIASTLQLSNAKGINQRAETLKLKYDFIISRAVTAFPDFVSLTTKLVSHKNNNSIPNGIIYLKGGDFDDELTPFKSKVEIFNINWFFKEPFFETKKIIYLPL